MNRLKTSEITAANHDEVYSYYGSIGMHKLLPRISDYATASIFHPEVLTSEPVEEYIQDSFESGSPLILVSNHVRYNDHNVVSSAVHQLPLLRQKIVGNTFIFGKAPYFKTPRKRWQHELANVVPVFRGIDIAKETGRKKEEISNIEIGRPAAGLVNMSVDRLALGHNLFLFPEGTRNRERKKWHKLLPLEAGIGHIAFKALQRGIDVGIVPIGLAYDKSSTFDLLKPVVQFGEPVNIKPNMKHDLITAQLAIDLQYCVDSAYKHLSY